jgi:hypothetical protein
LAVTQQMRSTGAEVELDRLPEEIETIAEALKRAGLRHLRGNRKPERARGDGIRPGVRPLLERELRKAAGRGAEREARAVGVSASRKAPAICCMRITWIPTDPTERAARHSGRAMRPAARSPPTTARSRTSDAHLEELFERFRVAAQRHAGRRRGRPREGFGEHGTWGHSRNLFAEIVKHSLARAASRWLARGKASRRARQPHRHPADRSAISPGCLPIRACEGRSLEALITGSGGSPGPRRLL